MQTRKQNFFVILGIALGFLLPLAALAASKVDTYKVPDVKNDYCGVEINFQYCKCAFHDQYCDAVNLDKDGAHSYVLDAFRKWNRERIQAFAGECLGSGGYWDKGKRSCTVCTGGDVLQGNHCVAPEKVENEKRCELPGDFEKSWEKYSDFDSAVSASGASYEVGRYSQTLDELSTLIAEAQAIEYDMEIDRETRLELREYKRALVQNIRNNITKAIFRLAWVTYSTAKGAAGGVDSYKKLLEPESVVEGFGAAMKLVQAHIPAGEKQLQFDTSTVAGQVKSVAWNATLEAMESVGDPKAVATQVMKDVKGAVVGGPDLTDEEVAILREQHLNNKAVDVALAESYAINAERRRRLLELEKQIAGKYNELQEWKAKEYSRVRSGILEDCKK